MNYVLLFVFFVVSLLFSTVALSTILDYLVFEQFMVGVVLNFAYGVLLGWVLARARHGW